jgi:TP901 family phage tail tape measure protein
MSDNVINYSIESNDVEAAIDRLNRVLARNGDALSHLSSMSAEYSSELDTVVYKMNAVTAAGKRMYTEMTKSNGQMFRVPNATKSKTIFDLGRSPNQIKKENDAAFARIMAQHEADQKRMSQLDQAANVQRLKNLLAMTASTEKAKRQELMAEIRAVEETQRLYNQQREQYIKNQNKMAEAGQKTNVQILKSFIATAEARRGMEDANARQSAAVSRRAALDEAANQRLITAARREAANDAMRLAQMANRAQGQIAREAAAAERQRIATQRTQAMSLAGGNLQAGIALGLNDAQLSQMQRSFAQANTHALAFSRRQQQSAQFWALSWDFWSRYVSTRVLNSVSYSFINAARQSVLSSIEIQKSISLVRTIGDKSLNFGTWTSSIRKLSDEFGIAMKDVSAGVYETISNQVADGAEAINFMSKSLQFAATTGSTAQQSMDLLSSVLNAFSLKATEATSVSASLFKTIDLGRVKAAEMADTYGRIAPMASRLGLSYQDLNASIATGTISGIKFNVASTEILNIMNKLLKPTKEMTKLYHEWGFETGQDVVAAKGWSGTLQALNATIKEHGLAYGSKLFNDIRAIRGIMNLTRDDMKAFNTTWEEFNGLNKNGETPLETYFKAVQTSFESPGKMLEMELNRFKNMITNDLGTPITEFSIKFIKNWGGIENVIKTAAEGLYSIAKLILSIKLANSGWELSTNLLTNATGRHTAALETRQIALSRDLALIEQQQLAGNITIAQIQRQIIAQTELSVVANNLAVAQERAAIAGSRLAAVGRTVAAFIAIEVVARIVSKVLEEQIDKINELVLVENVYSTEAINNSIKRMRAFDIENQARNKNLEEEKKAILTTFADMDKANLTGLDAIKTKLDAALIKPLDYVIKGLEQRINLLRKAMDKYVDNIKKSESETTKILSGEEQRSKILDMIDNIGKVDEKWNKARQSLALYQKMQNGNLVANRQPKETQDFFKQYALLTQYRRMTSQSADKAYAEGDVERGRRYTQEALALADKMNSYGWTLNEVYAERRGLLERQLTLEAAYKQTQVDQANAQQDSIDKVTKSMDNLTAKRAEYAALIKKTGSKEAPPALEIKKEIERIQKDVQAELTGLGKFDVKAIVQAGFDPEKFGQELFDNNVNLSKAIFENTKFESFSKTLTDDFGKQLTKYDEIIGLQKENNKISSAKTSYQTAYNEMTRQLQDTAGRVPDVENRKIEASKNVDSLLGEFKPETFTKLMPQEKDRKYMSYLEKTIRDEFAKGYNYEQFDPRMIDSLAQTGIISKVPKNTKLFQIDEEGFKKVLGQIMTSPNNTVALEAARNLATAMGGDRGPDKQITKIVDAAVEFRKANKTGEDLTKSLDSLNLEIKELNRKFQEKPLDNPVVQAAAASMNDGYISKNGKVTRIADDDNVLAFRNYTAFGKMISQYLKPSGKSKFDDVFMKTNGTCYNLKELPLAVLRMLGLNREQAYNRGKNYAVPVGTLQNILSKNGLNYFKDGFHVGGKVEATGYTMLPLPTGMEKGKVKQKTELITKSRENMREWDAIANATSEKPSARMGKSNTALSKYFWNQRQAQSGRGGEIDSTVANYYIDQADQARNVRSKPINARGITSGVWGGLDPSTEASNAAKAAYNAKFNVWQAKYSANLLGDKWGTVIDSSKTTLPSGMTEWQPGYAAGQVGTVGYSKDGKQIILKNIQKPNYTKGPRGELRPTAPVKDRFNILGQDFSIEEIKEAVKLKTLDSDIIYRMKQLLATMGESINDGVILKNGKVIRTSQDDNIYATKNDLSLTRPDYAGLKQQSARSGSNNPAINLNGNLEANLHISGRQLAKEIVPFMVDDSKKGRNSLMVAK